MLNSRKMIIRRKHRKENSAAKNNIGLNCIISKLLKCTESDLLNVTDKAETI